MEAQRNGFVPVLNNNQYNQYHSIPSQHPAEISLSRAQLNKSQARHSPPVVSAPIIQPVIGGIIQPIQNPRMTGPFSQPMPPQSAYYTYPAERWHFTYERYEPPPRNDNLNMCSKKFVRNCQANETPAPVQSHWIKPTIFYDGFWTEQKVKQWISDQFTDEAASPPTTIKRKFHHIHRTH